MIPIALSSQLSTMDSLLANYVSSDEEEEEHQRQQQPLPPLPRPQAQSSARSSTLRSVYTDPSSSSSSSSKTSPLFHSLPQPKSSSSLFQSLPNPKSSSKPSLPTPCFDNKGKEELEESVSTIRESSAAASSSLFSSLPIPNSKRSLKNTANPFSSQLQTKRLAQFNPPTTPFSTQSTEVDEDEDSDEEERERRRKKESKSQPQALSGTAFISSIIPAPRRSATLGTLPSSGSGRRSILETEPPVTTPNASSNEATDSGNIDHQNASSYYTESSYYNPKNYDSSNDQNAWNYASYDNTYSNYQNVDGQVQSGLSGSENVNYENYGSYGDYGQQYGSSSMVGTEVSASVESSVRVSEKRRRNEIPTEIIEVKQDELMKNRPREDQVKLTGIAFGPSYQAVSAKGKPSKLHKRKHQISSLYFDMRQKETELAERRAKGHLTKAETQAKYGW